MRLTGPVEPVLSGEFDPVFTAALGERLMRVAKRVQAPAAIPLRRVRAEIAERRTAGIDVISLGIGDPDLQTPPAVVEEAQRQVALADTHQYPSNRGRAAFREAVAGFYKRRFGVSLDPEREVLLHGALEVSHPISEVDDSELGAGAEVRHRRGHRWGDVQLTPIRPSLPH